MMDLAEKNWWHELNTWEPEQAIAFYGLTMGWYFEPAALPGADYWIARQDGRPVGGIFGLSEPGNTGIPSHWMSYLTVTDLDRVLSLTSVAGGEIIRPAATLPGVGRLAMVCDSTGAFVGLIEPQAAEEPEAAKH